MNKVLLEMGWPQAESHPQTPPTECRLDALQKNSNNKRIVDLHGRARYSETLMRLQDKSAE
ncbi:MAG: hypothetical protein ISR58_22395 [Anaerolineales bacterium]|nr:hypothetical protein [Anaerolineales bacterium]